MRERTGNLGRCETVMEDKEMWGRRNGGRKSTVGNGRNVVGGRRYGIARQNRGLRGKEYCGADWPLWKRGIARERTVADDGQLSERRNYAGEQKSLREKELGERWNAVAKATVEDNRFVRNHEESRIVAENGKLWKENCGSNRGLWEKHRTVRKARGCGRGWRIVGTTRD